MVISFQETPLSLGASAILFVENHCSKPVVVWHSGKLRQENYKFKSNQGNLAASETMSQKNKKKAGDIGQCKSSEFNLQY